MTNHTPFINTEAAAIFTILQRAGYRVRLSLSGNCVDVLPTNQDRIFYPVFSVESLRFLLSTYDDQAAVDKAMAEADEWVKRNRATVNSND